MEITNNKELKGLCPLDLDTEDSEFLAELSDEIVASQFSTLGLTRKIPSTVLDSFFKIVSYGLPKIPNRTIDSITELFVMKLDSSETKSTEKKIEKKRWKQRELDLANLTFEIREAFQIL